MNVALLASPFTQKYYINSGMMDCLRGWRWGGILRMRGGIMMSLKWLRCFVQYHCLAFHSQPLSHLFFTGADLFACEVLRSEGKPTSRKALFIYLFIFLPLLGWIGIFSHFPMRTRSGNQLACGNRRGQWPSSAGQLEASDAIVWDGKMKQCRSRGGGGWRGKSLTAALFCCA